MLYDPKWEKPSLAGIIAWLETKDPRQTYDFHDCKGNCLIGQYMAALGIAWEYKADSRDDSYMRTCEAITGDMWNVAFACTEPYTFGAALERARKLARELAAIPVGDNVP